MCTRPGCRVLGGSAVDPSLRPAASWRTIATVAAVALTTAAAAAGQPPPPQPQAGATVLVIDSNEPSRPAGLAILGAIRRTLAQLQPSVAVYTEAPDLVRFQGPDQARVFTDYLRQRYSGRRIDAILALGDPVTDLILASDSTPWRGVPVVAGMVDPRVAARARGRPGVTGFRVVLDIGATLDAAFALLPATRRVALVSGGDPYLALLEEAVAARRSLVDVVRLIDLPIGETRRRLAALPADTVVLYGGIYVDGDGRPFTAAAALKELAPASSVPIFGHAETYVGQGIVGGVVTDYEGIGNELARLAARVLSHEAPASIPIRDFRASRPIFDGRELDRWHLREARHPPGSQVLFRQPTLWQTHRGTVVATVLALLAQAVFIVALVFEARRRRRAQGQLRELGARLVAVQEEERSRIARELHDDVSQRLALFALRLDQLGAEPTATPGGVRAQAKALLDQARRLSSDVHRISHELHPAILDQLGLVAALQRFAKDLADQGELRVSVEETDWPRETPRQVDLAFYRVTQEALRNVVKHSGAREARVVLGATADDLTLCVSDAGHGFDTGSQRDAQLGIVGMQERLRQVGGALAVASAPGKGTVVSATAPRQPTSGGQADVQRGPAPRVASVRRRHGQAATPAR